MSTITTNIKNTQQLAEKELETARTEYLEAYDRWVNNRTPENERAMFDLGKKLERIRKDCAQARSSISARIANKQKRRSFFQWIWP